VNYIEPSLARKGQQQYLVKDETMSKQDLEANKGPRRLGKKSVKMEVSEMEIIAENQQYFSNDVTNCNMRDRGIINPGVGDIIEDNEENMDLEQEGVEIESSRRLFNRLAVAEMQKQSKDEH
jgi:hypothetical protein